MKRYNYFDDDDINLNTDSELSAPQPLEEPKPSLGEQESYVPAPKPDVSDMPQVVSVISDAAPTETESEDIMDAIKSFSHKSGEKIVSVARTVRDKKPLEELEKLANAGKGKKAAVTIVMLILTLLIFAGMIGVFMHSITKENRRMSDFNNKAGSVCSDYITKYGVTNYENLYESYGVTGYRMTGLCFARELDFDNDGTSELMLTYNKNGEYYNEVWGEGKEGAFTALFSEKAAQTPNKADDAWSVLYHHNNKYMIGLHSETNIAKVDFYQLKNNKFEKKLEVAYDKNAEAYVIDDKVDSTSFERIRYSVLGAQKAAVSAETAMATIERFTGSVEVTVKFDDKENEKRNRKSAFYEIVEEYNKRYGVASVKEDGACAYVDGLASVELIDFDNDGKEELVVVYRKNVKVRDTDAMGEFLVKEEAKYFLEVYRYAGSKAIMCYSTEGISNSHENSYDIYYMFKYEDKKVNYVQNSFVSENYAREFYANNSLLEFDGTEFKAVKRASWSRRYGYTSYTVDSQNVTESTFYTDCAGIPIFTADTWDDSVYKLTYVQRSYSNKAELDKVVEQTKNNILKLNKNYVED